MKKVPEFAKQTQPDIHLKNFQTKKGNKESADLEYRNGCAVDKILFTDALHLLCHHNSLKFFGKGSGKPFCKKVFLRKNIFN